MTYRRKKVEMDELEPSPRMKKGTREVDENKVGLPHGFRALPVDLLAVIEVERVIKQFPQREGLASVEGLAGHIVTLDYFSHKNRIEVKSFSDPKGIQILVDGKEVFRSIPPPEDYPGPRETMERQRDLDGNIASMLDLEPGDEVIEEDGELVVVREGEQWTNMDLQRSSSRAPQPVARGSKKSGAKRVAKSAGPVKKATKKVPSKAVAKKVAPKQEEMIEWE